MTSLNFFDIVERAAVVGVSFSLCNILVIISNEVKKSVGVRFYNIILGNVVTQGINTRTKRWTKEMKLCKTMMRR